MSRVPVLMVRQTVQGSLRVQAAQPLRYVEGHELARRDSAGQAWQDWKTSRWACGRGLDALVIRVPVVHGLLDRLPVREASIEHTAR